MSRSLLEKMTRPLAVWTGVAVLGAVVAMAQNAPAVAGQSQGQAQGQPQDQSQGQPAAQPGSRTDGQIEMDVVHALDASAALKNDLITAATIQSEVTLSGTVSTEASKQLAQSIAAHVDGVTKVNNNLKVGNPAADAQNMPPPPDSQEMPDPDQSQAQQQTAGLPPPGPEPNQSAKQPQNREPGSCNSTASAAAAIPAGPAVFAVSTPVPSAVSAAGVHPRKRSGDAGSGNAAAASYQRARG